MSIKLFLNTTRSEYLPKEKKSENKSWISTIYIGIQLMCTLRTHINHLFLKTFYGELKKQSKKFITFSFFRKKFPKIVYYCVSLGHTSV